MLLTYFRFRYKKFLLKNINILRINSVIQRFVSVQPLVVNKPLSYRFYDSSEYRPKPLRTLANTWKPYFINKINSFGDLPEVLIKNSKWFSYWQPLFKYWKKKKFNFKSRDLLRLDIWGSNNIDLTLYLQLPLGISYSPFWNGVRLEVNHTGYKWLTIFATNETALSDVFLKKLFNTANIYILASTSLFYPGLYEFKMLVRSKEDKFIFFLYGLKCRLTNFLCFQDDLRVWRFAKKKCVSLKSEVGDFIYYIHSEKKRMVFYQHIGGVIKKIGKTKFDRLKQSLPVKQKKNSVFENV